MPKTQYFTAASLDGFIADSDNSLDWLFQAEATAKAESASGDLYHEFYAQVGALAKVRYDLRHPRRLTVNAIASETIDTVFYVLRAARAVQRRRPRTAAGSALAAAAAVARLRAASAEPLR